MVRSLGHNAGEPARIRQGMCRDYLFEETTMLPFRLRNFPLGSCLRSLPNFTARGQIHFSVDLPARSPSRSRPRQVLTRSQMGSAPSPPGLLRSHLDLVIGFCSLRRSKGPKVLPLKPVSGCRVAHDAPINSAFSGHLALQFERLA